MHSIRCCVTAKITEPIDMPLGVRTPGGPGNDVLCGDLNPLMGRSKHFWR